jgi:hypothetical protein
LTPRLRRFQEFSEPLFALLDSLTRSGLGHLHDRSPEVELVSHIGADGAEEQQEKVCGVAED